MTTFTVYDPPMCCSTGVCGADVDQQLVDFAADLDWLKSQGAEIRRINLSQEPMEFVSNPEIKALMDTSGSDGLPAIMVAGEVVSTARFPSRNELAEWAGLEQPAGALGEHVRELIALGAAVAANCKPCLKYHAARARKAGVGEEAMREAIAMGRTVRASAAIKLDGLAEALTTEVPAAEQSCCGGSTKPESTTATGGGCCGGGSTKDAPEEAETASSCC